MPLASGCQHIALVTSDLDRLLAFYGRIFDASTLWILDEGDVRHALVDLGGGFCLHPFQFPGDHPETAGKPDFFARGHLDHFSIAVADRATLDRVRDRLMAENASDGTLADWGVLEQISFRDPDGMEAEVSVVKDGTPRMFRDRTLEPYH
jgi:catechol 2,3-dioxygenase-like lactoylglutathione lyase family enzyme